MASYSYRPQVLDELGRFGLRPTPETRPELVHDFLNDLYRYELRRLRDRLMRRDIPKAQYSAHVIELRRRYYLLSVPLRHWTV